MALAHDNNIINMIHDMKLLPCHALGNRPIAGDRGFLQRDATGPCVLGRCSCAGRRRGCVTVKDRIVLAEPLQKLTSAVVASVRRLLVSPDDHACDTIDSEWMLKLELRVGVIQEL